MPMNSRALALILIACMASPVACRTAEITATKRYEGGPVQQPRKIYVFDFRTEDAEIILADEHKHKQTEAKRVARALSLVLVDELEDFEIPIERRTGPFDVPENSVAIHGEILRVDEGSTAKRALVGFGYGASNVDTLARVYLRGPNGPEEMVEYRTEAKSGRKPGILTTLPIGMAVQGFSLLLLAISAGSVALGEINASVAGDAKKTASEWAERLEELFRTQGWLDEGYEGIGWD
jgi:hypothetical protein